MDSSDAYQAGICSSGRSTAHHACPLSSVNALEGGGIAANARIRRLRRQGAAGRRAHVMESASGWPTGGRGGWCGTVLLRGRRLGLPCDLDLPGTAALRARHLSAPLAPLAALRLSAHVEGVLRVLEETLAATSGALDGTCPVALLAGLLRHPSLLCQALRTTPKSGRNCSPSSRRPSLVRPPAYSVMLAPPDAAVNVERKRGRLRPSRELPCPPKARGYPPGGPRVSSHASMHVAQ